MLDYSLNNSSSIAKVLSNKPLANSRIHTSAIPSRGTDLHLLLRLPVRYHALFDLKSIDDISPSRVIEMEDGLELVMILGAHFHDFVFCPRFGTVYAS